MPFRQFRLSIPRPGPNSDRDQGFPGEIVHFARLRNPRLYQVALTVLAILTGVCLVATLTRMSAVPLVPIVPFGFAGIVAWFAATTSRDEARLWWLAGFVGITATGFWLMSWAGRLLATS